MGQTHPHTHTHTDWYNIKTSIFYQGKVQDHNVGIILPHEVFSVLYHYKRPLFEKLFINSGENERFWTYCESAGGLAICNYMKYVYIYIYIYVHACIYFKVDSSNLI